jgi:hypothetical protein
MTPPDVDTDANAVPARANQRPPTPCQPAKQAKPTSTGPTQPPASARLSYSVEGQSKA